jgi:FkbM family methyltransferase
MTFSKKIGWLFRNHSFRQDPLGSAIRLAYWMLIYCPVVNRPYAFTMKSGQIIFLPPQKRGLAKFIFAFRENYDLEDIRIIKKFLKPGHVFIDVGANLGFYSVVASELVGANGRVIAFEPAGETFQYLSRTVAQAAHPNILPKKIALSDAERSTKLFHHPDPSRYSLGDMGMGDYEIVETLPLDQVMDDIGIDRVDFIKCDVEGLEEMVFKGAQGLLERFHPGIYFEINLDAIQKAGLKSEGAWSLLAGLGYAFFTVDEAGEVKQISSMPGGGNILALYGNAGT